MAHHVAHREHHPVVRERDHVVPVASHLASGVVPSRQAKAGHLREPRRQQAPLQRLGHGQLARVALRMLDGARRAIGHQLQQIEVARGELQLVGAPHLEHALHVPVRHQRRAHQGFELPPDRTALHGGGAAHHLGGPAHRHPAGEALTLRHGGAHQLLGLKARGRHHPQRLAIRVGEQDRRAVRLEHAAHLLAELDEEVVQREVRECHVGHALELADGVRHSFGLLPGALLAQALGALRFGPGALGQVDRLGDGAHGLALRAQRRGDREQHIHVVAVLVVEPALGLVRRQVAGEHALHGASVVAFGEVVQLRPDQLGLGAPGDLTEGAVHLAQAAVLADQRDADRGVEERRPEALLALPQRAGLLVQVHEDGDLRAQHVRVERLEQVVDRAHRVAAEHVVALLVDRGQEDDRQVLRVLSAADVLRRLEAVEPGHLHVQQREREVLLEQALQRLLARAGLHDPVAQGVEHGAQRHQVLRQVVDDQDVRHAGPPVAPRRPASCESPTAAGPRRPAW